MIQRTPFPHALTGVGLSLLGLRLVAFGLHQHTQCGLRTHLEVRGATTGMAGLTCKRRLRRARLLPVGVRLRGRPLGWFDLTGQVQAGGFDHLVPKWNRSGEWCAPSAVWT